MVCILGSNLVLEKNSQFRQFPKNSARLFDVLAQFVITTTEIESNNYCQKKDRRFASWIAEPMIITLDLKNIRNIKIISEMIGIIGQFSTGKPKLNL